MREDNKENDKLNQHGSFKGLGHTLGGGSSRNPSSDTTASSSTTAEGGGGVCHVPPSPEEVRRLRLAAFGGGGGAFSSSSKPKPKSPAKKETPQKEKPAATPTKKETQPAEGENEDEDEELRAALALSMRCPSEIDEEEEEKIDNDGDEKTKTEISETVSKHEKREREQQRPSEPNSEKEENESGGPLATSNLQSFHSVMWDTITTTLEDKNRWKNQGIRPSFSLWDDTNDDDDDDGDVATPMDVENETKENEEDELVNSKNSKIWGLTQSHGGPCGVLAAVQAEMLRLLLFGVDSSVSSSGESLHYPTSLNMEEETLAKKHHISPKMVREAMAKSIGMILARAAVMPSPDEQSKREEKDATVRLVLPLHNGTNEEYKGLTWQALEPWNDTTAITHQNSEQKEDAAASDETQKLGVWTISSFRHDSSSPIPQSTVPTVQNEKEQPAWTDKPESKRQRNMLTSNTEEDRMSISSISSSTATKRKRSRTEVLIDLANAVAHFLLHESTSQCNKEEEEEEDDDNDADTNMEKKDDMDEEKEECCDMDPPLKYFHSAGGVMLLTLSLVESRGVRRVKDDMDDPCSTLTSQFGHSSQELINLLLTGQAVSNVFDNTLTVSGAFSCQGIQSRPFVGYLSLLESLRYCEVGGYYKSPNFPIWVVGSQNHFSVLFGDERCLKESKSDVLLEKCRRAFKAVEGGEENGFIEVSALGKVIDSLNLREKVGGDNGVQTLAATLEVSGAGIILWDDFWKASSRLLTGASIESILEEEPEQAKPPLLLTQHGEPTHAPKPSTMESDEELAKFLAAEWGAQDQSAQSPPSQQQSSASATHAASPARQKSDEEIARELQAQWDAEMDGGSSMVQEPRSEGNRVTFDLQEGNNTASTIDVDNDVYDNDAKMTSVEKETSGKEGEEDFIKVSSSEEKCPDTKESSSSVDSTKQPAHRLDFEKFGDSFPLYHYNGLRGGTLTSFRVTRLTPEEAVGASIALSSNSGSGGGHGGSSHSGASGASSSSGGGDLEDVVRTKWPSCVFNWGGTNPPFID